MDMRTVDDANDAHLRFDALTRDELSRLAPQATAVVALGSTEQHGPHLPVRTDTAIITALAERAVEQAARDIPVVLTPTLPFGFADHHLPFGGTISVNLTTYIDLIVSIGRSLAADGFRRILFLNGHGGNDGPTRIVGDRLVVEDKLDVHVAATSYWTCAADALAALGLDIGPAPGHAGSFETSLMQVLHPALIRTSQIPKPEDDLQPLAKVPVPGAVVRHPNLWQVSDGRTDDSQRADADIGEKIITAVTDRLAEFIVDFHRSTNRSA